METQTHPSPYNATISTTFGNSSSSSITTDQDQFQGSNDFILVGRRKPKTIKHWIREKIRSTCSKKVLKARFPIINWLPKYNLTWAIGDFIAGLTIALTVIPQGLAYSRIIGVAPQYGLYGSFLGSFVYIFFGSCKAVAVGPTAMMSLLVYEAVKDKGLEHTVLLCFLSGVVEILMGVFGLGFLIDFISGPVLSGFVSASAIVIVTSQIEDMLGIQTTGDSLVQVWTQVFRNIENANFGDTIVGFSCLISVLILKGVGNIKIGSENPRKFQIFFNKTCWFIGISRNAILVIISSAISYCYCQKGEPPFHIIGPVPAGFPTVKFPPFGYTEIKNETVIEHSFWSMLNNLGSGLLIVPVFGLLENILICKTFADGKAVDAKQEFIAIGVANIANSFVQAFSITGALARSAVNFSSGVKTTLGGLYTGLLVIISLFFLTPYFYYIPKPTLAAIIIAAAIFMVEIKIIKPMWKAKKSDLIPGIATFVACLTLPFQYGVIIGVGVNLMFIMYHAARPKISMETQISREGVNYLLLTPDRCLIFPSVTYVRNLVNKQSIKQGIPVVIDCTHIYGADYTSATVIKTLTQDFWTREQPLFFYNLKSSVSMMIDGLAPEDFVVFYNGEEFDEMLRRWCVKKRSALDNNVA